VSVIDDWDGFGQKTTGSGTLKVHQVHLPASHLIPFDQRFKFHGDK
jgi:alkylation response protein AidB-like acyl-CoA dehydrogenase